MIIIDFDSHNTNYAPWWIVCGKILCRSIALPSLGPCGKSLPCGHISQCSNPSNKAVLCGKEIDLFGNFTLRPNKCLIYNL